MTGAVGWFDTVDDAGGRTTEAVLETAAALASAGRVRDAVAFLTETNRGARDPRLEIALAALRHAAFDRVTDAEPPPRGIERKATLETVDGVPQVEPDELGLDALEQGLEHHGCLFVPGLLAPQQVTRLVEGIERTFDEFDRWQAQPYAKRDDESRAWFSPFHPVEPYAGRELGGRLFTRSSGAIWTVESPRMLFEVIEMFEAVGLGALVAAYLGERPALSAAKCNLRRTPADIEGAWHQDGSFLGREVAALDIWIALSTCGRDAPGLDIVPRRIDELLEAGPDTVSIPHEIVLEATARLDADIVRPAYNPGDVLIFDQMFVHRTAIAPEMTRERHALETWFFAPSRYPASQIPFLY